MADPTAAYPATLERIVTGELGGRVHSAETVSGGLGGHGLWRVRASLGGADQTLLVKLGEVQGTPVVADDAVEERVYGVHSWSLAPVHALLQARGLPTYELIGHGFPTAAIPAFWVAMSELPGVDLRGHDGQPDPRGFYRTCGGALGALHAIQRSYDGVVDRQVPHGFDWTDAFFQALERVLARAAGHADGTFRQHELEVRAFVEERRTSWVRPRSYSLSHVDGLQGHGLHDGHAWRFTGHVDLEDFVFLDPRFALAGFELGAHGPVHPDFWDAYREHVELDPSYEHARPLLELYYLLDWFWLAYNPRFNPTPADIARGAAKHTAAVLRLIRDAA